MARRLRVLFVASHPVQYASPLFRRYAAHPDLDPTVAYCSLEGADMMDDPDFGRPLSWDVSLLEGYRWIHLPNASPRPALRGFVGLLNPRVWRLIAGGRPDVVVSYLGYSSITALLVWLAAKWHRVPIVLSTDAHVADSMQGPRWKAQVKRVLLPWIFRSGDGIFVPSTRTGRYIAGMGIAPERTFLTPYVVDNDFFADRAAEVDRDALRESWGVPRGATVALFVGKLVPWKRPADVLDAVAHVPGAWAVFAGDGRLRTELETLCKSLGIDERVRFLGFVNQSELPAVYAGCDVLVLPSSYEAFGVVVNEMFACGKPAIVSDACGAVGDLVRTGETGAVTPVGDIDAIAAAVDMLSDPATRERMGGAARAAVAQWGPQANADAVAGALRVLARRA